MQMRIVFEVMFLCQDLMRIKFPKSFPRAPSKNAKMLVIVDNNVPDAIDFFHQRLHLALVGVDEVLQHLLRAKRYFEVIA